MYTPAEPTTGHEAARDTFDTIVHWTIIAFTAYLVMKKPLEVHNRNDIILVTRKTLELYVECTYMYMCKLALTFHIIYVLLQHVGLRGAISKYYKLKLI